jgi:hypothetical protein
VGVTRPVTVSIGVATSAADGTPGPTTWRELFDLADLHLFGAKRNGRNRVRAAGGQLPAPGTAQPSSSAASVDDLVAEVLGGVRRRPGWAFEDNEVAS